MEKIIQFGEGNFLRAFVDWMVSQMNHKAGFDGTVVAMNCTPRGGVERLERQNCQFHLNLQGRYEGQVLDTIEKVDSITRAVNPYLDPDAFLALADQPSMRFVVSNTTEAGIVFDPDCRLADRPAASFPAKLTQLLYRRFCTFQGAADKGFIILPCELIFGNGRHLRECVMQYIDLWRDELAADYEAFRQWVLASCPICTTLVDRIVPGHPRTGAEALWERIGGEDPLLVQAEPYHLWVIEVPEGVSIEQMERELPAKEAGLNVLFVRDEAPYHQRKVTLLNGPHTVLSPVAFLSGIDIVRDACNHPVVSRYINKVMFHELLPTLDLPQEELEQFGRDVLERFNNPYINHQLTSIMLNSFSKFTARDLPGLKTYLERKGELPRGIVLGLAAIIVYYRGGERADGTVITPQDNAEIVELLQKLWNEGDVDRLVQGVLSSAEIWGEDLTLVPGLQEMLIDYIQSILQNGMLQTIEKILA